MKKARTCRLIMSKPHYSHVVKCTICGSHHIAKIYRRCPGCGRIVEDAPIDKSSRKEFDRMRGKFFQEFRSMMLETNGQETPRGGNGRRVRRTINAGRR